MGVETSRPEDNSGESGQIPMRLKDLTSEQSISVPCPTCGVATGKQCVLLSGGLRSEPHVDRKIHAAEAIEIQIWADRPDH